MCIHGQLEVPSQPAFRPSDDVISRWQHHFWIHGHGTWHTSLCSFITCITSQKKKSFPKSAANKIYIRPTTWCDFSGTTLPILILVLRLIHSPCHIGLDGIVALYRALNLLPHEMAPPCLLRPMGLNLILTSQQIWLLYRLIFQLWDH